MWPFAVALVLVFLLAGAGAFWLLRPQPVPAPQLTTAPVAAAPKLDIITATESEIAEHVGTSLTVFRFADNPRILVLDFASLHEQGEMLNRVAAFIEKAGLPHDRVLTDHELDEAIRARGDTVETFYFGHDYAAKSIVRFFAFADNERIQLTPQEETLRALLQQQGWFAPDVTAGLISVPAVGSDPRITPSARAAILRHELSHGEFFSEPEYADFTRTFWLTELTESERGAVRNFLANEGYDPADEELMFNEMQAYLMFTRDPTFFRPDMVGMTPDRLAALQEHFFAGMPASWLRDILAGYAVAASAR